MDVESEYPVVDVEFEYPVVDVSIIEAQEDIHQALDLARQAIIGHLQFQKQIERQTAQNITRIWDLVTARKASEPEHSDLIEQWIVRINQDVINFPTLNRYRELANESQRRISSAESYIDHYWGVGPHELLPAENQGSKPLSQACLAHLARLCRRHTLEKGRQLLLQNIKSRVMSKKTGFKPSDIHLKLRDITGALQVTPTILHRKGKHRRERDDGPYRPRTKRNRKAEGQAQEDLPSPDSSPSVEGCRGHSEALSLDYEGTDELDFSVEGDLQRDSERDHEIDGSSTQHEELGTPSEEMHEPETPRSAVLDKACLHADKTGFYDGDDGAAQHPPSDSSGPAPFNPEIPGASPYLLPGNSTSSCPSEGTEHIAGNDCGDINSYMQPTKDNDVTFPDATAIDQHISNAIERSSSLRAKEASLRDSHEGIESGIALAINLIRILAQKHDIRQPNAVDLELWRPMFQSMATGQTVDRGTTPDGPGEVTITQAPATFQQAPLLPRQVFDAQEAQRSLHVALQHEVAGRFRRLLHESRQEIRTTEMTIGDLKTLSALQHDLHHSVSQEKQELVQEMEECQRIIVGYRGFRVKDPGTLDALNHDQSERDRDITKLDAQAEIISQCIRGLGVAKQTANLWLGYRQNRLRHLENQAQEAVDAAQRFWQEQMRVAQEELGAMQKIIMSEELADGV